MSVDRDIARPRAPRRSRGRAVLVGAAVVLFVLAPVEGYLLALHPQLGKIPALLMVGAWLVFRFALDPKPRMHAIYVLLAALTAIVLASTAIHVGDEFTMEYASRWVPFLVICAVLTDVASSIVGIRLLMASAVTGGTLAALGAIFSVVVLDDKRASGPLSDPNDLAYVLVAALLLTIAFTPHGKLARLALLFAAITMALAITMTLSRGGLIAVAVGLLWILLRRAISIKVLLWTALGGTVVSAALLTITQAWPLVTKALAEKDYIAESNIDTRLTRWQAAARMLSDDALLGVGPGGFREHYVGASHLAEISEQTPVVHNMYLEVAAELGVLGLAAFIGLIIAAFVSTEIGLRRGFERRTVVAVQASLLGIVVASFTLSEQYYFPLWSTVALACAIGLRAKFGGRDATHSRAAHDR